MMIYRKYRHYFYGLSIIVFLWWLLDPFRCTCKGPKQTTEGKPVIILLTYPRYLLHISVIGRLTQYSTV